MAWCHQATSHCLSQCWPRPCHHMTSLGHNELMQLTPLFLTLVPHMDPGLENPCILYDAMWCFSSITVSWKKICVCWSQFDLLYQVYILLHSSQQDLKTICFIGEFSTSLNDFLVSYRLQPINYTPAQRSSRGGILDSPCLSVRLSVDDMVSGA